MKTIDLGSTAAPAAFERVQILNEAPRLAIQYVATGDPTAITVDVEGSLDEGATWGVVESHAFSAGELTNLSKFSFVVDKPLPYVRLNVSTLTFTTAGTIQAIIRYDDV